jgi:UDP-N-acetylglucosamine 2-epimerase (non-hydrolysing)
MAKNGVSPASGITLVEPLGYLDFICLMRHAEMVVTDSGGVQEETTFLRVPCLTVRPNTERPITVTDGTNRLVAAESAPLIDAINDTLASAEGEPANPDAEPPELWDGRAATRIASILSSLA